MSLAYIDQNQFAMHSQWIYDYLWCAMDFYYWYYSIFKVQYKIGYQIDVRKYGFKSAEIINQKML